MARHLRGLIEQVDAAHVAGGMPAAEQALAGHEATVERILKANYQTTVRVFGTRILEAFKSTPGAFEAKSAVGIFEDSIERFINEQAARKAVMIGETTRQQIASALIAAEQEGAGVAVAAGEIVKRTGGAIATRRALLIARTETHMAANTATMTAATATGLTLEKEWIANTGQERTRETHIEADGQTRRMTEFFSVGGHSLRYPGDPDGPAKEIINCRCVLGFKPKE